MEKLKSEWAITDDNYNIIGITIDNEAHIVKISNQPERSKREDSQKCEMRCSEHCGNTVRDK